MSFARSRTIIRQIRSAGLRDDLNNVLRQVEKLARSDKELAGKYLSSLIRTATYLQHALPTKVRIMIVNSLIDDGLKNEVPHQFEREEGYECNIRTGQCVPNPETTCIRDTWTNKCIGSG